ncbi:MAG: MFS transporter [Rhodospirillaceae bacterium]|nr:MFS transporter [Rhodospirillaceae bacterium]
MTDTALAPIGRDLKIMGLVGTAHAASHFFHLVLPPLFPILKDEFGVSYTELGLLPSLFFAASGFGQSVAGFLVDHYGARRILLIGLSILSLAVIGYAMVGAFWMLIPLSILAGLGNAVFHPADLSILTSKVSPGRLGRAYGTHAISGNLGWAAAPALMITLAHFADWRTAVIVAGCIGLAIVAAFLIWGRDLADERQLDESGGHPRGLPTLADVRLLFSATILSCFAYFTFLAAALIGVQTFGVTAMVAIYEVKIETATAALTAFLLGSASGILLGGIAADRTSRHDLIAMGGMIAAAIAFAGIGLGLPPTYLLIAALAVAGFLSGTTSPSRDMLVRKAAPKGASGRVFGFVYSGLDLGSAVMPLALGILMDNDRPDLIFLSVSGFLIVTAATVIEVRKRR